MRKLNDGRSKNIGRVVVSLALGMLAMGACSPATQAVRGNGPTGEFGDGANTLKYVDKLDFQISGMADSIWVGDFECNPSPCSPKDTNTTTKLMFVPYSSAQHVNWENNLKSGAAGDVVAMVINVDDHDFVGRGKLTLAPGQHAFAWVGQIGSAPTDRGFGIYTIDDKGIKTGGPWARATTIPTDSARISYCRFDSPPGRKPAIHKPRPEKCKPETAQAFSFASVAYGAETSAMMQPIGGPLWFSCDMGCCEISANAFQ